MDITQSPTERIYCVQIKINLRFKWVKRTSVQEDKQFDTNEIELSYESELLHNGLQYEHLHVYFPVQVPILTL